MKKTPTKAQGNMAEIEIDLLRVKETVEIKRRGKRLGSISLTRDRLGPTWRWGVWFYSADGMEYDGVADSYDEAYDKVKEAILHWMAHYDGR